jgi:hypothetical protein
MTTAADQMIVRTAVAPSGRWISSIINEDSRAMIRTIPIHVKSRKVALDVALKVSTVMVDGRMSRFERALLQYQISSW